MYVFEIVWLDSLGNQHLWHWEILNLEYSLDCWQQCQQPGDQLVTMRQLKNGWRDVLTPEELLTI